MNPYDFIGWMGMILFLINYAAVSNGKMQATGKLYNSLQVVAAAASVIGLLPSRAYPMITLNVIFMMIGLWTIFKED